MAIHQWSSRRLRQVWLRALAIQALLLVAVYAWAATQPTDRLDDLLSIAIVIVSAWSIVPLAMLIVTWTWYWARRRVREVSERPPAT